MPDGKRPPNPQLCIAAGVVMAASVIGLFVGCVLAVQPFICGVLTGALLVIGIWMAEAGAGD